MDRRQFLLGLPAAAAIIDAATRSNCALSSLSARKDVLSNQPPVIPVGLDAYRRWDCWPYQRIGVRAYMRSTYDRSGGNKDAGNFLFQLSDNLNVTLDLEGPGILYFARYNHCTEARGITTLTGLITS